MLGDAEGLEKDVEIIHVEVLESEEKAVTARHRHTRRGRRGDERGKERKGGRLNRKGRGCLSLGQVRLTLNCLALEIEHLSVPKGLEERGMQREAPPPKPRFLSPPRFDLVHVEM